MTGHARRGQLFHRHGADADRRRPAPRPFAARSRLRPDRPPSEAGLGRGFRIDGLSGPDPRILRAAARRGLRACRQGVDFKLGYSPERINPGDKQHRLETIVKIVAGEDAETLERVAAVYGAHRRCRGLPGILDRGRRGGKGHREHPARPQHRADERAGDHLRPPRHSDQGGAARRRAPSGTSCRSRPGWSAATASASTPTT